MKVIAYYSGWGMIYITKISYGINDTVTHFTGATGKVVESKIRYTKSGDAYFMTKGHRIPLDECIRCDFEREETK